jgi:hypothetical protein
VDEHQRRRLPGAVVDYVHTVRALDVVLSHADQPARLPITCLEQMSSDALCTGGCTFAGNSRGEDVAMTWTWRRTMTGLAIACTIGLLAGGVFLVGEQQRTRIVDHGSSTPGVITADHDDEFDHWYTVSYTAQGKARSADLRYPWVIDKMRIGQALTVYVDPDHPERIATASGYSTPAWTSAPGFLAVLAIFAAFISIAGRLLGTRQRRTGGR